MFLFNWKRHAKFQALLQKKEKHLRSSLSMVLHSTLQFISVIKKMMFLAFFTHDSWDSLKTFFFFWRSRNYMPGHFESLHCEVNLDQIYSTDGSSFDEDLKKVNFRCHCHWKRLKSSIYFQSISRIPPFRFGAGGKVSTGDGGGARGTASTGGFLVKRLLISSWFVANETKMLMMLSHCVIVRTFLVLLLSTAGVSATGGASCLSSLSAMMLCASTKAFFCASRAC